jgi:Ankyrin repeats (many copies)/Ankyrin repeats (3 copies)
MERNVTPIIWKNMFEYLTELYLAERAKRLKNRAEYDADSKKFSDAVTYPRGDVSAQANYYMASTLKQIHSFEPISPTKQLPLAPFGHAKPMWTACMIVGMIHPDNKFDHRSISRWPNKDIEQSEIGYFTLFGSNSLYETMFKPYLNKEKVLQYLQLGDNAVKKYQAINQQTILENMQKQAIAQKQQAEFKVLQKNQSLLSCINNPDAKLIDIKGMLDNGAELNYQDKDGYTALMLTIKHNNEQIAEYLLKLGANPLLRNKQGKIASELAAHSFAILPILKRYELLSASSNDDLPTITTLIMHQGCDVNFRGHNGKTALLLAVAQGQIQLVRFLLANHADITLVDKDGQGVFDLTTDEAMLALLETAKAMPASVQQTAADTLPDFKASADGPALTPLMAGDEMFGLFAQTKILHQEAKEKTADLTP